MLELKSIIKDYPAGEDYVHALKGIDLEFRPCEFVSILGPSGCGKTTMLNIIGGLDHYTSGDLVINGTSTKEYKDRDWDAYRNHSIGFVFQSYNLIPHQTVLQNVELALTLSGVSRDERKKRALEALDKVGLSTQVNKKPAEMSGGQMQRVAIARAIVNNPDIILADEPTGALDSETSIQVMDILKEISKNRLVIMVTHNPDLAEKYSTRIIRMLDGVIQSDSNPLSDVEYNSIKEEVLKKKEQEEQQKTTKKGKKKKEKKPSMSLFTSFTLSLKNLFSKRGRTILTSFAGSIGIIGIALIYAVSQGTTNYIDIVQEQTLSSYPITLEATSVNYSSLISSFVSATEKNNDHPQDAVYTKTTLTKLINAINSIEENINDLKDFKTYFENRLKTDTELQEAINGIQYSYNFTFTVYTKTVDQKIHMSNAYYLLTNLLQNKMNLNETVAQTYASYMSTSVWTELLEGQNGNLISPLINNQYDLVYGSWPNSYDEAVIILDENNEISEVSLYALGLIPEEEVLELLAGAVQGTEVTQVDHSWSYEDICNEDYKVVLPSAIFGYDQATDTYSDLRSTDAGLQYLYENGMTLRITGIIKPNPDALTTMLGGSIGYTSALKRKMIEDSQFTTIAEKQRNSPQICIFDKLPFADAEGMETEEAKANQLDSIYQGLDEAGKADMYKKILSIPSDEYVNSEVDKLMVGLDAEAIKSSLSTILTATMGVDESMISSYMATLSDTDIINMYRESMKTQVKSQYEAEALALLESYSDAELAQSMDILYSEFEQSDKAYYYDLVITFSQFTYKQIMDILGAVDIDNPETIYIYPVSFDAKEVISNVISEYNDGVEESKKISYTDLVALLMSSITTIIHAVTYVLIAFVAISLIVSSIMIGVITLISVQERTKEIGILRAIGASKANVSSMFNAETILIGFSSGLLGVIVTYLLCIPINLILHSITNLNNLNATLPIITAIILIAISCLLTLISGIIPSRSAAKKDPVVALRSE